MKRRNDPNSQFRREIIALLEKYTPKTELNSRLEFTELFKKERISTWHLAWLFSIVKKQYACDNIPWDDECFLDIVYVEHNIIYKKILEEIGELADLPKIQAMPASQRNDTVKEMLGISFEISIELSEEAIPSYWIERIEDPLESKIFLALFEGVCSLSRAQRKAIMSVDKYGSQKHAEKLVESLVRLAVSYPENIHEKIFCKIIKGEIFSYVFFPEHDQQVKGAEVKKCSAEWCALTQSQANFIISNPKERVEPIKRGFYFGVDDLWVSKDDISELDKHSLQADDNASYEGLNSLIEERSKDNNGVDNDLKKKGVKARGGGHVRGQLEDFVACFIRETGIDSYDDFVDELKKNYAIDSSCEVLPSSECLSFDNHTMIKDVFFIPPPKAEHKNGSVHFKRHVVAGKYKDDKRSIDTFDDIFRAAKKIPS